MLRQALIVSDRIRSRIETENNILSIRQRNNTIN